MTKRHLLAACFLQFPVEKRRQKVSACADGIEGHLILGLFIPLTIIVLVVCLGRACWTWHLTHGLAQWAYDPYLDFSLRSKHPAHVEAPLSRGRTIHSFASSMNQLFNRTADSSPTDTDIEPADASIDPASRLALATHKIGFAMVSSSTETLDNSNPDQQAHFQTVTLATTFKNEDGDPKLSPGASPAALTEVVEAGENDSVLLSQSFIRKDQSLPGSLFHPDYGFSQTYFSSNEKEKANDKLRSPNNPYGDSVSKGSVEELPTALDHRLRHSDKKLSRRCSRYSLKGHEPRFSTYTKVKCAQFQRRVIHSVKNRHVKYPTSRDLQRDVRLNEDRVMYDISVLGENLSSGCIVGSYDNEEAFRLGPVRVPLRPAANSLTMSTPTRFKTLRLDLEDKKKRTERSLPSLHIKRFGHKSSPKAPSSRSRKQRILMAQKSQREPKASKRMASDTSAVDSFSNNAIENNREFNDVCRNSLEARDPNASDDDEVFTENYNDIFEELFAKAALR